MKTRKISPVGTRLAAMLLFLALLVCSVLAHAHEYWLEPVGNPWHVGDKLEADIRNGEDFAGSSFPFNPDSLSRAGLISPSQRVALSGRLGDYPAFQMPLNETGLHLLLLETTRREISYEDRANVDEFLHYHGLTDLLTRGEGISLPDSDITEFYYRFCKALVNVLPAVSDTQDADTGGQGSELQDKNDAPSSDVNASTIALEAQEQRLEIVLSDNPLGAARARAQVLLKGEPLALRQIELFHRDGLDVVTRRTQRTDESGYAEFDIAAEGDYLLNAVWLEIPEDASVDMVTLWASLFFHQ